MDKEIYAQMHLHEDKHWWFAGRRMIIKSVLDKFYKKDSSSKIMEVGCGTGGNLALLSSYGQLSAVELNDEALEAASTRKICRVFQGSLPDNLPLNDQFDLICMLDVLEHIEDDAASISHLASRLNPNGMLLITVPAYMFLWSSHDEVHHHKRRYTKKYLENLIIKSGLTISYATYFNTLLFPIVYSIRIVNKIFNKNWASGVNTPSPIINWILQHVFHLEIPLLNMISLPFGVSILVLAKKPSGA